MNFVSVCDERVKGKVVGKDKKGFMQIGVDKRGSGGEGVLEDCCKRKGFTQMGADQGADERRFFGGGKVGGAVGFDPADG